MRKATRVLCGSFKGLSRAKRILCNPIRKKMNMSNDWLCTTLVVKILKQLVLEKIYSDLPSQIDFFT